MEAIKKTASLLGALGVLLSVTISAARAGAGDWPWKGGTPPGGKIGYIRPQAPSIPVQPVAGVRYQDLVPDTPDVAEMSKLSINVLTCADDCLQDYEQYLSVYIGNPLRMAHNFGDWCTPKYMESLALLRTVTGGDFMSQVDQVWQDSILKSIGPDGLFYFPLQGKPWYGKELWWAKGIARADGSIFVVEKPDKSRLKNLDTYALSHAHSLIEESGITQFTHPQPVGRIVNVLTIYYLRDGNPLWKRMLQAMVDRFDQLAIRKGDWAYFPQYLFEPGAKFDPQDPKAAMPQGLQGGEINGRFIRACALDYRLTGDKKALALGRLLTNFMLHHDDYFGPNGEFTGDRHFHGHTNYLIGMLEYADATHDKQLLDYCRKSFEWAKSPVMGFGPITGYAPETLRHGYPTAEGCAVGDMVVLACNLSAFGAGDYYEDAERWCRNYFSEIQLTRAKADHLVQHGLTMEPKKLLSNETDEQVAQRNLGAFASWAGPNEWWAGFQHTDNLIMHCCTGNCTRALHFLWRHILDYKDGELTVNMLLNRASPWADVYSYIPYEGRVDIKIKQSCSRVLVHAPEWLPTGHQGITARVDGKPHAFTWRGRYVDLGGAQAAHKIVIEFPISERTVKEKMGKDEYTLTLRGNTVVWIDPPGTICPLFQRDYYRDGVRWRQVQRFVADKPIDY